MTEIKDLLRERQPALEISNSNSQEEAIKVTNLPIAKTSHPIIKIDNKLVSMVDRLGSKPRVRDLRIIRTDSRLVSKGMHNKARVKDLLMVKVRNQPMDNRVVRNLLMVRVKDLPTARDKNLLMDKDRDQPMDNRVVRNLLMDREQEDPKLEANRHLNKTIKSRGQQRILERSLQHRKKLKKMLSQIMATEKEIS